MSEPAGSYLQSAVEQGILVLTVTQPRIEGEEAAQALREQMLAAVAAAGAAAVVIDLRHIRYMSSVAFWPLLTLRRQLKDRGRLVLCGMSEEIEDLFRTTKLISSDESINAPFLTAGDRAAAVARLTGPGAP